MTTGAVSENYAKHHFSFGGKAIDASVRQSSPGILGGLPFCN